MTKWRKNLGAVKLRQRILITLLPISLIGIAVLSVWSYSHMQSALYSGSLEYSRLVLKQSMQVIIARKYALLERGGVDKIPVFRQRYAEEVFDDLESVSAELGRDFLVFDITTGNLLMSTIEGARTQRQLDWLRIATDVLRENVSRTQGGIEIKQLTIDGSVETAPVSELYVGAFDTDWNWLVIVTHLDSELTQASDEFFQATLIITAGVAVMSFIAFQLLSSRLIIYPIQHLKRAVIQIAETNKATKIPISSGDEIGDLARGMEDMSEAIEEAMARSKAAAETKSAFLANMSHEIRTPMNGMLGMIELMKKTDLTTQQSGYMTIMNQTASVLMSVINDILDISKLEAGRVQLEKNPVDIIDLIRKIGEFQRKLAEDRGNALYYAWPESKQLWVMVDPVRVQQCVSNLLNNATKFTENGTIHLGLGVTTISQTRCRLRISVTDTGIGIAPEKLDRLFERFEQADLTTTREYGGTGLGLSIVRQLMDLMGGAVNVVSTEGEGSLFTLEFDAELAPQEQNSDNILIGETPFPRLKSSTAVQASLKKASQDTPANSNTSGPPNLTKFNKPFLNNAATKTIEILVIEPDRITQSLILAILDFDSLAVSSTGVARDALGLLESKAFDVVILADQLPDGETSDLMANLNQENTKAPKIILLKKEKDQLDENLNPTDFKAAVTLSYPLQPQKLIDALTYVTQDKSA